jgi:hypothetical protein
MTRACRHDNADHLLTGDWFAPYKPDGNREWLYTAPCEQFRCLDCRAWLSLGPARDRTAAVLLEIRAAYLADLARVEGERAAVREMFGAEHHGWDESHPVNAGYSGMAFDIAAGYLARIIFDHDEAERG